MRFDENKLTFKVADDPREFAQMERLNYQTFVEEIPQHPPNDEARLDDPFVKDSTCLICLHGDQLVGMTTISAVRPFSLDRKLDLEEQLPLTFTSPCEIRLLAVDPEYRGVAVLRGLIRMTIKHFEDGGHDIGVISGARRLIPLYRRLGFTTFGPPLGTEKAPYQGMYATLESIGRWVNESEKAPA